MSSSTSLILASTSHNNFPPIRPSTAGDFLVPQSNVQQRIDRCVSPILQKKQHQTTEALNASWGGFQYKKRNPVFWGGDLLTFGYLALDGAQAASSSLKALSGLTIVGGIFGILAGLINIGVGICSIPEALEASRKNDILNKTRLWMDVTCMLAIGLVMILASIAKLLVEVGIFGAMGLFFASNPWFLLLLFFVITLPTLLEVSHRVVEICRGKDWGSKLALPKLHQMLHPPENNPIDWERLRAFLCDRLELLPNFEQEDLSKTIADRANEIEHNIGVEATLPLLKLLKAINSQNANEARDAFLELEKEVRAWYKAQAIRFTQQIFYVLAFVLSMGLLKPNLSRVSFIVLTGAETAVAAGANAIALYMDLYWPFKRNTPIILSKVEESEHLPPDPIQQHLEGLDSFFGQLRGDVSSTSVGSVLAEASEPFQISEIEEDIQLP